MFIDPLDKHDIEISRNFICFLPSELAQASRKRFGVNEVEDKMWKTARSNISFHDKAYCGIEEFCPDGRVLPRSPDEFSHLILHEFRFM